jgi:lactoylglutathione lyase
VTKSIIEDAEKGKVEFTSDEVKPTLEGGRMILFKGPNQELLQLVERLK